MEESITANDKGWGVRGKKGGVGASQMGLESPGCVPMMGVTGQAARVVQCLPLCTP